MNNYTILIKKHNYYDVSRYSESSGNELDGISDSISDSISDISLSDHELQLKEIVISSDFNNNNYDNDEFDSEDYNEDYNHSNDNCYTSVDDCNDLDQNYNKSSFKKLSFACAVKGCTKKYTLKDSLNRHIQYHHIEENTFISTHDSLKDHQQKVHEHRIFYICMEKGCYKSYDTVNDLGTHQRIKGHEGVIQSEKKYTNDNLTKEQHISINRVREQIFKCSKEGCNKSFDEIIKYVNHLRIHPDGESQKIHHCDEPGCDKFFINLYGLWNHIRFDHSKEIIERIHKCEELGCNRSFDSLYGLFAHKRSHTREKTELEKTLRKNEIKIYERKYPCKIPGCNRVFDNKSGVACHKRVHMTGNDKKSYKCDIPGCDKMFENLFGLLDHGRFHLENNEKVCDEPETSQTFRNLQELNNHQQTHTNNKLGQAEINCDIQGCSFKTERFEALKWHLDDDHNLKSYHVCDKEGCSFCCTDDSNFHKHQQIHVDISVAHVKEKLFECENSGCDKVFKRLCHLRYHQNRTGHQTSKIFTNQQHKQQNHSEVDKNNHAEQMYYVCDEPGCDKVYKRLCHFRYHQNRRNHQSSTLSTDQQQNHSEVDENHHTKKKYYVCDEPGCDKVYKRLCHFRYHQNRRNHQSLTLSTDQQQNHSEVDENHHTKKKYYVCDEPGCDKVYKRLCHFRYHQNRRNHQSLTLSTDQQQNHSEVDENHHTKKKYYVCDEPGCDKVYKRLCHFRYHQNRRNHQSLTLSTDQQQNHSEVDENHHTKKKYYVCDEPGCDKVYKRLCHFRYHQNRRNHQSSTLSTDQQQNHSEVDENHHTKKKYYICDEPGCDKVYKRLYHLRYHQKRRNHQSSNQQQNRSEVDDHINILLPYVCIENVNFDIKQENTYCCDNPGCFYITGQVENLTKHKMIHTEEKRFDQINYEEDKVFVDKQKIGIKTKPRVHACNYQGCNKRYITLSRLEKHEAKVHSKNTNEIITLKSSENHDLNEHMKKIQIPTTTTHDFVNRKRSGIIDDKSIGSESNYGLRKRPRINKIKFDDDDNDCLCKFTGCRKIFDSIRSLKIHQQRFHMITKTYSCDKPECNFRTKFFEKLEKHQIEKHRMLM